MRTFDDAVAQLQGAEAGGFDFSATQAATLLNEGLKRLASRSEWIRTELDLGPTVAAQELYSIPDNVVHVRGLAVGGVPYLLKDVTIVWDVKNGTRSLHLTGGVGGIYAERFDETGIAKQIGLWPIPEADELPIVGLASIEPDDLKGEDQIPFPPEFRRAALDYAKGIAYEDVDENPTSGNYFMGRAETRAEELRQLANRRVSEGPLKIPVAGHSR